MEDKKTKHSNENKSNKKRLISFAKINKYFIFPFLCPIIGVLFNYFWREPISNIYNYYIHIYLSYIIGGIPYIILLINKKCKRKDSYSNATKFINKYTLNNKDNKNNSKKKWLIIILICLLNSIFRNRFFLIDNNLIDGYLYYVLFIPLFSKLILKIEIYKHQYLSLIISIIALILANINSYLKLEVDDIVPNIINFILILTNSLTYVLIKYIFNKYFISFYKLCFLQGIFFITFDSILFLIYSLIKYSDLSIFNDCFSSFEFLNTTIKITFLIICILLQSANVIFRLIVIFYFSPILYFVTDIIQYLIDWILKSFQEGTSMPYTVLYPIGSFIVLLSSLIYNEIIILNFWGLNKNTKIFVEYRQNIESIELSNIKDSIILEDLKILDDDERHVSVNSDYYLYDKN